jgi:hypothetical protein
LVAAGLVDRAHALDDRVDLDDRLVLLGLVVEYDRSYLLLIVPSAWSLWVLVIVFTLLSLLIVPSA